MSTKTLREQINCDKALIASLPKEERDRLELELHQIFNRPGYNFEPRELS